MASNESETALKPGADEVNPFPLPSYDKPSMPIRRTWRGWRRRACATTPSHSGACVGR